MDPEPGEGRMYNPYENVNWSNVRRVPSATHMHLMSQSHFENGYRFGMRHFPISNYYPSAPYDATTRQSDFRLRQWWPATRDGKRIDPPINWNDIIDWSGEVEEEYRLDFPFEVTPPVYGEIRDDVILSHNAEHHGFTNSNAHICSPGSSFASGTFDVHANYQLNKHGFTVGFGGTWQEGFEGMLEGLDYPDAGGITINHPTWFSRFTDEAVFEMLDYDEAVMGIEIYNNYSARRNWLENPNYVAPDEDKGFSLNLWDRILRTGRRCWGFCVPDHSVCGDGDWNGRSVLLVSEFTEYDCLRAYRLGRFYSCLKNSGLTVEAFSVTDSAVSVKLSASAQIKFISDSGVLIDEVGDEASCELPMTHGEPDLVFLRVEVAEDSGERLFLQPLLFAGA